MTKVSYVVRKNGFKGSIKCATHADAVAKAKEIGGYYKAVYTQIEERPLTIAELELRQKRMAHFGLA